MTTKDKVETLISIDRAISQAIGRSEARLARQLERAASKLGYDCLQADLFGKKLAHEIVDEWATQLAEETKDSVVEPVEPKGETCPKCGSDTVIITEVKIRRCSKCGYEFVPCPCGKTIRPANSALQYCEYCHTYFGTNDPEKDTVPWEKPQTNFERWKEGLKPEDLLRYDEKSSSSYKQSIFGSCSACPAHKFCDEWYEEFSDVADMVGLGSCENLFNEWANTKAKDEEGK